MKDNIKTLLSEDLRSLRRPVYIVIFILLIITAPISEILFTTNALLCALTMLAASKNIPDEERSHEDTPIQFTAEKYIFIMSTHFIISLVIFVIALSFSMIGPDPADGSFISVEYDICYFLIDIGASMLYFSVMIPAMLFGIKKGKGLIGKILLSVFPLVIIGILHQVIIVSFHDKVYGLIIFITAFGAVMLSMSVILTICIRNRRQTAANGIKALLRKDITYLSTNNTAMMLLICITGLMSFFPILAQLSLLIPFAVVMSAFHSDISAKWSDTALMLPYSTEQITLERYIFAFGVFLIFLVPSAASSLLGPYNGLLHSFYLYFFTSLLVIDLFAVVIPLKAMIRSTDIFSLINLLSGIVFLVSLYMIIDRIIYIPAFILRDFGFMKTYVLFALLGSLVAVCLSYLITLAIETHRQKK